MASSKGLFVDLVLRARDLISPPTADAADSVERLAEKSEELKEELRSLEDQKRLVSEFGRAEKQVSQTSRQFERAQERVRKLETALESSGDASDEQVRALAKAKTELRESGRAYNTAQKGLDELGEEAKQAGINTSDLAGEQRRLNRSLVGVKRDLSDTKKEYGEAAKAADRAGTATKQFGDNAEGSTGRLGRFNESLRSGVASFVRWGAAAAAATGALAVTAITRATNAQAELARQTLAQADAFGVSAEELQRFKFAAQAVGIEGDKAGDILKDVADKIGDAFLNDAGPAKEVIEGLGLELAELVKLPADKQLRQIGAALSGLPKAGQVQVLEALANDSALLLPLLENNNAELIRLGQVAQDRNAIFSEDELERLSEFNEDVRTLGARFSGFIKQVTADAAPAFSRLAEAIDAALGSQPELIGKISERITDVIVRTAEWVNALKGDAITSAIENITQGFRTTIDVVTALKAGFVAVVATVGEVGARVAAMLAQANVSVLEFGNSLKLVSDELLSKARTELAGLTGVVEAFDQKADEAAEEFTAAMGRIAGAASSAGRAATDAGAKIVGLKDDVESVGRADTEGLADVADELEGLGTVAFESTEQYKALAKQLRAAQSAFKETGAAEAAAEVQRLKGELETARDAYLGIDTAAKQAAEAEQRNTGAAKLSADQYKKNTEEALKLAESQEEVADKAEEAGRSLKRNAEEAAKAAEESVSSVSGTARATASIVSSWAQRISTLSRRAAQAFGINVGNMGAAAEDLESRLLGSVLQLRQLEKNRLKEGGLVRVLNDVARSALRVEVAFLSQSVAARNLTERISEGRASLAELNIAASRVNSQFNLLDRQQLEPLRAAIRAARQEFQDFNETLVDGVQQANIELAGLRGNQAEVARLRAQQDIEQAQQDLNRAREIGDREAIKNASEQLRLVKEIAETRIQEAESRAAEVAAEQARLEADRARVDRDDIDDLQDRLRRDSRREQRDIQRTSAAPAAASVRTIRLEFNGAGVNIVDDGGIDSLLAALERAGFSIEG